MIFRTSQGGTCDHSLEGIIPMNPPGLGFKTKTQLQGLAASLTAVASALQHGGGSATDAMHATSEYLASGIGALTVWDAQGKGL